MAPLVLLGTVLTHLFGGGSAGREGTAVQMGASLSDWLAHRLKLARPLRRQLLAAGVAGGFGSVFGPIAGRSSAWSSWCWGASSTRRCCRRSWRRSAATSPPARWASSTPPTRRRPRWR